jgi:hypothetical protein
MDKEEDKDVPVHPFYYQILGLSTSPASGGHLDQSLIIFA